MTLNLKDIKLQLEKKCEDCGAQLKIFNRSTTPVCIKCKGTGVVSSSITLLDLKTLLDGYVMLDGYVK